MANFLAPFHAPKFTDEEFREQRDKYIAKYGYTVTVPAAEDIIHFSKFKPLTEDEATAWKERRYDDIPADRREDIQREKTRKKKRYLAMLGDPSPQWAQNAGAILTALDNTQDAVATLACIGMMAAAVIGGPVAAAVLGPLGVILGATTLLNMLNPMSQISRYSKRKKTGHGAKRITEQMTNKNPFSKQAKVKLAKRISKFKPSMANAIEAVQVTDNIFGVGLCLGPIVGFVQGAISGTIRTALGQKVKLATSAPKANRAELAAAKALTATALLHGIKWHSDATEETISIHAASLGMQVLYTSVEEWNPIEEVDDIGEYLVECPQPTDPLTVEILEETGFDFEKGCVWPQNGKRWISITELQETTEDQATANLRHYGEQNNHSLEAFNALAAADDFALNFLAAIEGPDQIRIDYLHTERIVLIIMENGWTYPENITPEQIQKFEDWCYVHDYMDTQPTGKDIWNYAEIFCGFTWATSKDEFI